MIANGLNLCDDEGVELSLTFRRPAAMVDWVFVDLSLLSNLFAVFINF
jgi:hypothetical protein